ncbi:uncharacterized protein LOC62_03G005124 [Vanrija pseudolonga]|uniref:Uncharacterized protein n=1 Tax=Vanrija pseudolonga TaxID=143232 RepID=A0AAF0Y925_9TREE|nr:hypothetical protein LOC62_03G005124 [Vanrija pseudolonga]
MVLDIVVQSKHSNTARVFPHSGFFGVTPVIIAGTLHMKLPAEVKSLPIRSIQVAATCYETKDPGTIRSSAGEHILWEKRRYVWQPPPGQVESLITEDWDIDFRISIPPEAADLTKSTQLLREWRAQWRLEILIEHKPIKYVGEGISRRFTLNLYNHRTPPPAATPFPTGGIATSGKDLASTSHVFLAPPTSAFGPGDNVPLAFAVRVADPSTSVRKVQVILERRLEVYTLDRGTSGSRGPSPDDDDTGSIAPPTTHRSHISNLFNRSSSPRRLNAAASASSGNLISTQDLESYTTRASVASTTFTTSTRRPPKVEIHKVGVSECELTSRGESGSYWAVGNIALPRRLPNGGAWDIGESGSTPLARISFSLYTKVWVKTKRGSSPKETVSAPVALTIVGVPEEDRARAAQAKATREEARAALAEARTSSRAHLKPARRTGKSSSQLYLQAGDVDISSEHIASISRASLPLDKNGRMASPSASPPDSTPPVALRPILLRHDGDGDHIRNPHSTIQFVPAPDAMPVSPASTVSSSRGGSGGGIQLPSLQSIFPSELYPSPASPQRFAAHEYTGSPHSPTAPLLPVPMEILDSEQGHDESSSSSWHESPHDSSSSSSSNSQYRHARTAIGGRRISSTTSDDEEQPLRNRPRLGAAATPQRPKTRAPLPSLDALGFGLPALPEDYRPPSSRRPRTAPSFSAYSASGMARAPPPPPLSGAISHDMGAISHDANKTPTQEYPHPQAFSDSRAPSKRPSTSGSVFSLMRTAPPFGYSS